VSERKISEAAAEALEEMKQGMGSVYLGGVEGPALEAYATTIARIRDARRRIDKEGLVVADEKGRPIPHPALAIEKMLNAEIRAWLARYQPKVRRVRS